MKCHEEKHADLLLIREEGKRHYFLLKDFSTFMYEKSVFAVKVYTFLVQKKN